LGNDRWAAWLWILQYRTNAVWATEILPAHQTTRTFENSKPDLVAVSAVDRNGNMSSPAALKKTLPVHVGKSRGFELIGREGRAAARPSYSGRSTALPIAPTGIGIGLEGL